MKYTKKRHSALISAAGGIDYPGTIGVRIALERQGLLSWRGPLVFERGLNRCDFNFNMWRITTKGRDVPAEWDSRNKNNIPQQLP